LIFMPRGECLDREDSLIESKGLSKAPIVELLLN
jgi:hypothetical protein